ncbi:MAG: carboxypeptidase regulatory-like domain-containing protein [Planctomycetota bacterium]|jgi:protocatechuate 3,4-dioxygenase beta subunit
MAKRKETLLVAGLVAVVVLIVGAGLLLNPSGEGVAPPDEESSAARARDRAGETPPDLQTPASRGPSPARDGGPARAPAEAPVEPPEVPPLPERSPAPIGVLAGQVRTPDGSPIEGVTVKLWYDGYRYGKKLPKGQKPSHTTESDPYGDFRFENLPPGHWRLEVAHADFAPRNVSGLELTDEAGVEGVPVVLYGWGATPGVSEDVGAVEGRVTDRNGEPVVGAVVTVRGNDGGGSSSTKTDEDGNYRVEKLLPGGYRVELRLEAKSHSFSADAKKPQTKSQFTNVAPGKVTRVDFSGSGALTGVVLDAKGNPLVDVIVRIAPLDEKGMHRGGGYRPTQVRTDKEGRFRIEDAGEGRHSVGIQSVKRGDSFAVDLDDIILTGGDQDVTLQLQDSGIMGRITAADTGEKPEARPQISLYRVKPWGSVGMAFMDKEGRYRFKSIPPGEYRIIVFLQGHRRSERDLTLAPGELKRDVNFEMNKLQPGTIIFRVKDQDGNPVEGLSFSYTTAKNMTTTLFANQTEPGVYVCKMLETGTWEVHPYRADLDYKTVKVKVVAGQTTEVEVVMGPRKPR